MNVACLIIIMNHDIEKEITQKQMNLYKKNETTFQDVPFHMKTNICFETLLNSDGRSTKF